MSKITLLLLGSFVIESPNQERPKLRRKTRALLAYLAATYTDHSRQHLMTLFCAEAKNPPAVLRSLFSRLRRNLGADILLTEDKSVRLNPARCWVDYQMFRTALEAADSANGSSMAKILALYQGEFLADVTLKNAPLFETWLLAERARCRALHERGLTTAVSKFSVEANWDQAIFYAQRLVTENPLLEEAHGRLMWLYAQTGQIEAARAQYQQCYTLLKNELAVEPVAKLQQLNADIEAGRVRADFVLSPPHSQLTQLAAAPAATLIGREQELEQLRQAWQRAQQGQGRVILLEAEAGGGKSHLIQAFCRKLSPAQFWVGEGYESTQSIPYTPWLELLEMALLPYTVEQLKDLPHAVRTAIAQLIPAKSELSQASPLPTERLLTSLATFLLQDTPRLLFIDNLQWADSATLVLFNFLARRVPHAPIVLVGAYRPAPTQQPLAVLLDDLARQAALILRLDPLSEGQITLLLAEQWSNLSAAARPRVAKMLFAATAGNPLFLTEFMRELAHTTAVPASLPLPPSVLDLIMRRLRRLPAGVRQVVESLAVLYAPGSPALLRHISGRSEEETAVALDVAIQQGFIAAQEGELGSDLYDFQHDLMREAVSLLLSKVRRRLLHKRTALGLERMREKAAVLAYHWQKAGDPEQESRYALLAGQDAYRLYANEQALSYLLRSLELAPQSAAWRQLGDLYLRTGEWEQAQKAYQEALALAKSPAERSQVQFALGRFYTRRSDYETALAFLESARQYWATLPPSKALSDILNQMGIARYWQGNYEQALTLYEESRNVAEAVGDSLAMAMRIGNIGIIYLVQQKLTQAQQFLEASLRLCRQLDDQEAIANRLGNLALVHSARENYAEALMLTQEALRIDQSLGKSYAVARDYFNISNTYFNLDNYYEGLRYFILSHHIKQELDDRRGVAVSLGNLALVLQDLGELSQANRYYCWIVKMDLDTLHPHRAILNLSRLGQNLLRQGNVALAKAFVTRALALGKKLQVPLANPVALLQRGKIAQQQGEFEEASAFYQRAIEAAEQLEKHTVKTKALVQLLPLLVKQQKMGAEDAATALQVRLAESARSLKERAFLYDALWQVTQAPSAAQQAAQAYATLYQTAPLPDYRRRYFEYSGEQLPPPPQLPPLPQIDLPDDLPTLDTLLAQIDRLLS